MGDEARLISISKAGRQQLDQLLAQEREQAARGRGGWHAPAPDAADGVDADQTTASQVSLTPVTNKPTDTSR
jgi:hypothetical protein